jgi:hypothetical protein
MAKSLFFAAFSRVPASSRSPGEGWRVGKVGTMTEEKSLNRKEPAPGPIAMAGRRLPPVDLFEREIGRMLDRGEVLAIMVR